MQDPAKREYAEELLSHSDSFNKSVFTSIKLGDLKEAGETQTDSSDVVFS